MLLDDLTLEVRDRTLTRVGQVTAKHLSFRGKKRWCGVGEWTLTLPGDHKMVPHLMEKGSGIILTGPVGSIFHARTPTAEPYYETVLGPIMSGPTWKPQRVRNRQNPDGTFTFTGHTDEVHLLGALAFPSPEVADPAAQTRANDTRTGSTEDLMRAYVAYNIANGAVRPAGAVSWAPTGRLRGMRSKLVLEGESASQGITQQKSPRFQPLLELLTEMASGDPDYGFEVVQVGDLLHFRVLKSTDRTKTIRLDVENGTITSEEVQTQGPTLTDAIVLGQGEGTDRTVIQRTTPEAEAAEEEYGLVWERVIDQRQTNDPLELQQAGDEALEEGRGGTAVKMLPSDDSTMQYGRNWVVGDLLTTVVLGVETVARSTEAVFIADSSGVMVGTAIGDVSGFTTQDAQGAKVISLDERVTRLERLEQSPAAAGIVVPFGGGVVPRGFLLCNGSVYDPVAYPALYAAIGTTHGGTAAAPLLPDYRGRTIVGFDATQAEFDSLGEKGGAKTVALTEAQLPAHKHNLAGHAVTWGQGNVAFGTPNAYAGTPPGNSLGTWQNTVGYSTTLDAGSGQGHNNLQPYAVANYIISTGLGAPGGVAPPFAAGPGISITGAGTDADPYRPTLAVAWGMKGGPVAHAGAPGGPYASTWQKGIDSGEYIDAHSNALGILINATGVYEIQARHRAASANGYATLAINGDRTALENRADGVFMHDHGVAMDDFSISEYIGVVPTGTLITHGPPSGQGATMRYGVGVYAGSLSVKRLR